jgi:hypothetical protein
MYYSFIFILWINKWTYKNIWLYIRKYL